jgi:hypothetical protein
MPAGMLTGNQAAVTHPWAWVQKARKRAELCYHNWFGSEGTVPVTGSGHTAKRILPSFVAIWFLDPIRVLRPRLLPTDPDYAVPTRGY